MTECILYSLSRTDLNRVLESNPAMAERIKRVAEERLANDAKLKASAPAAASKNS